MYGDIKTKIHLIQQENSAGPNVVYEESNRKFGGNT
jgi:hypothetical protein